MFTLEQIRTAHAKVKSGADFPSYIQELKGLGLIQYCHFVSDGHTEFLGKNNYSIQSDAKYPALTISNHSDIEKLGIDLKAHQKGETNYLQFCELAASTGVEKWIVDLVKMTCTYCNKTGENMLTESIPG